MPKVSLFDSTLNCENVLSKVTPTQVTFGGSSIPMDPHLNQRHAVFLPEQEVTRPEPTFGPSLPLKSEVVGWLCLRGQHMLV